jgi:hypothetical protein
MRFPDPVEPVAASKIRQLLNYKPPPPVGAQTASAMKARKAEAAEALDEDVGSKDAKVGKPKAAAKSKAKGKVKADEQKVIKASFHKTPKGTKKGAAEADDSKDPWGVVPEEAYPAYDQPRGRYSYTIRQGKIRIEVQLRNRACYLKACDPEVLEEHGRTITWSKHGGADAAWQYVKRITGWV